MTVCRSLAFICVCLLSVCLSHTAYAKNELEKPSQEHEKFEILYHEVLPPMALESKTPDQMQQGTESPEWIWTFESFGRSFTIFLESNDRLIAKLPQLQHEKVVDSHQLLRGKIAGIANSWVRLTRIGRSWYGMIWDGQEIYIIDPMSVIKPALQGFSLTESSNHGIYRLSDTRELESQACGSDFGSMHTNPLSDYGALVTELRERVTG